MADATTALELVRHHAARGLFGLARAAAEAHLSRAGHHDQLAFWKAFCVASSGGTSEAVRLLEPLAGRPGLGLAVTAALITTHSAAAHKDRDAIAALKARLKEQSGTGDPAELTFAGRYFLAAGREKQARKCADKALAVDRKSPDALVLYGWLNLGSGNDRYEQKSLSFFEAAAQLEAPQASLPALLGRAAFHERRGDPAAALEDLGAVVARFPAFVPAQAARARLLAAAGRWDDAVDAALGALEADAASFDAMRVVITALLTREAKPEAAARRLREFGEAAARAEPDNAALRFEVARLAGRLAGHDAPPAVLEASLALIDAANRLRPLCSEYLTEQAAQLVQLGAVDRAAPLFSEAAQLDEANADALYGGILCKVLSGHLEQAAQELEFLQEVADVSGKSPELLRLSAMLRWRRAGAPAGAGADGDGAAEALALLDEAVDLHDRRVREELARGNGLRGPAFLVAFNPRLVGALAAEYMHHVGAEPPAAGEAANPVLDRVVPLLQGLGEVVPGDTSAQLRLARCLHVAGRQEDAADVLLRCARLDPNLADAHILHAQVSLARGGFKQAAQSLEQAVALSFEVRNRPVYYLMRSRLLRQSGRPDEALKLLESAMQLPGVRRASARRPMPASDRVRLFLDLAAAHAALGHTPEATKLLQDARHEFEGTGEADRVAIAEAGLAAERGDVDRALGVLREVRPGSVYYTRAKVRMADIYLVQRRNPRLYAACYEELAYQGNTVALFTLLGEAYTRVQETAKAIRAYEEALKLEPNNSELANRIGRALVGTHDYAGAMKYYEAAVRREPRRLAPYLDLARLYLELGRDGPAGKVLEAALQRATAAAPDGGAPASAAEDDDSAPGRELERASGDVSALLLLARVHEQGLRTQDAEQALQRAYQTQRRVLELQRERDPDGVAAQRERAAELCWRLAQHYERHVHDPRQAVRYHGEALQHDDAHRGSLLALAKLHLAAGELDLCSQKCKVLRRVAPEDVEVSMMLADILFRKGEYQNATLHFQQLLEAQPTHYRALERLVRLLRRSGQLESAPRFLAMAERSSARAQHDAGFRLCQGLYHHYANEPRLALKSLNLARKDGEWGEKAVSHMIQIYLNPDTGSLFQEAAEAKGGDEGVQAVETLLKELHSLVSMHGSDSESLKRYRVLEAYSMMSSGLKVRVESAIQRMMELLRTDKDYVPALLAVANGYLLLKQTPKARNHLKRVSKMTVLPAFEDEFERAWLMLADLYIKGGKYDLATGLCRKALEINKSSAKAWEQMGIIMEKEEAYKDAAEHYEHAWHFNHEASAPVGFRLAFNYLKARRFVEAIDVCHKVLANFPDYPKIRRDILDKARGSLRP